MRLFVALEVGEPARTEVLALQERLRGLISRQGVRFTRPERLHLTLSFLGNVEASRLEALKDEIARACENPQPVTCEATGLGCFPDLVRPGVVWAGVRGADGALEALQARVAKATESFAEHAEAKAFTPHLTLARISPPSQAVGRMLAPLALELLETGFGSWTATEAVLYETAPGSGEHIALTRFPLLVRAPSP